MEKVGEGGEVKVEVGGEVEAGGEVKVEITAEAEVGGMVEVGEEAEVGRERRVHSVFSKNNIEMEVLLLRV